MMEEDGLDKIRSQIIKLSYSEMIELARELDDLIGGVTEVLESRGAINAPLDPAPNIACALWTWAMHGDCACSVVQGMKKDYWREEFAQMSVKVQPHPSIYDLPLPDQLRHPPAHVGKDVLMFDQLKPILGIPFSISKLKSMGSEGKFPKPIRIGSNRLAWVRAEIEQWIADRAAERGK